MRSGYGGLHAGRGGSTRHEGHRHHSHRPRWISPVPFLWHTGWYFGGCSWIWSDWNCWNRPGYLLPPPEEVDGFGPDFPVAVGGVEDQDEESGPGDDVDATPMDDARSASALVFDVFPEDAVVYVDDEYEGTAAELNDLEGGLSLPPGEHIVTVLRPGFRDSTVTVKTRAGESTDVEVALTR